MQKEVTNQSIIEAATKLFEDTLNRLPQITSGTKSSLRAAQAELILGKSGLAGHRERLQKLVKTLSTKEGSAHPEPGEIDEFNRLAADIARLSSKGGVTVDRKFWQEQIWKDLPVKAPPIKASEPATKAAEPITPKEGLPKVAQPSTKTEPPSTDQKPNTSLEQKVNWQPGFPENPLHAGTRTERGPSQLLSPKFTTNKLTSIEVEGMQGTEISGAITHGNTTFATGLSRDGTPYWGFSKSSSSSKGPLGVQTSVGIIASPKGIAPTAQALLGTQRDEKDGSINRLAARVGIAPLGESPTSLNTFGIIEGSNTKERFISKGEKPPLVGIEEKRASVSLLAGERPTYSLEYSNSIEDRFLRKPNIEEQLNRVTLLGRVTNDGNRDLRADPFSVGAGINVNREIILFTRKPKMSDLTRPIAVLELNAGFGLQYQDGKIKGGISPNIGLSVPAFGGALKLGYSPFGDFNGLFSRQSPSFGAGRLTFGFSSRF